MEVAKIEVKMQSLGLFEQCTNCGEYIGRGEAMNAVVSDNGEPLGWYCNKCIGEWEKQGVRDK